MPSGRWPPRRRASRQARSTRPAGCWPTAEAGPLDESQRAQVDLLRGRDRVRLESGQRRAAAAARRPQAARAARPRARPRDLPGRVVRGDVRRPAGDAGGACWEVAGAPCRAAPAGRAAAPADLLLDGLARFTEGYAAARPTLREALRGLPRRGLRARTAALVVAGDRRRALELWDDERAYRCHARSVELARDDRRARVSCRSHSARARHVLVFGGRASPRPALGRRERAVSEATGTSIRAVRRVAARGAAGQEAETRALIAVDHREARPPRGEGIGVDISAVGARGPVQRPRPLRRAIAAAALAPASIDRARRRELGA